MSPKGMLGSSAPKSMAVTSLGSLTMGGADTGTTGDRPLLPTCIHRNCHGHRPSERVASNQQTSVSHSGEAWKPRPRGFSVC